MTERPVKHERFVVVKNATGRSSCWPIGRQIPSGWTSTPFAGTKQQCLDAIRAASESSDSVSASGQRLKMSMMFFGDSEVDAQGDKYRLLTQAARFADANGFAGLWLPERHFTKFGCLYPNPAVLHASLASQTKRLALRAGSVVMPLNDPIRVAEEWAVVDNLSAGRAEVAFASGWHPDDFALMPDAYEDRNQRMLDGILSVQRLWRGDSIYRTNGSGERIRVRTYPTPIRGELPIWLTAAGNPNTFRRAGQMGAGVLTHLFNQDVEELEKRVRVYRDALRQSGHDDADARVAVTLHTFVSDSIEAVRRDAGEAYCDYLRANMGLLKQLAFSQGQSMDIESLPKAEMDQMLHWLLDKFIGDRSLMGTVETCLETCRRLAAIGVTEVACLMDFGPETDVVLGNLPILGELNQQVCKLPVA